MGLAASWLHMLNVVFNAEMLILTNYFGYKCRTEFGPIGFLLDTESFSQFSGSVEAVCVCVCVCTHTCSPCVHAITCLMSQCLLKEVAHLLVQPGGQRHHLHFTAHTHTSPSHSSSVTLHPSHPFPLLFVSSRFPCHVFVVCSVWTVSPCHSLRLHAAPLALHLCCRTQDRLLCLCRSTCQEMPCTYVCLHSEVTQLHSRVLKSFFFTAATKICCFLVQFHKMPQKVTLLCCFEGKQTCNLARASGNVLFRCHLTLETNTSTFPVQFYPGWFELLWSRLLSGHPDTSRMPRQLIKESS